MHSDSVFVLATTTEGTSEALREAQRRAPDGAAIHLLVAHVADLEPSAPGSAHNAVARLDEFSAVAASAGVPVSAYACICEHPRDLTAWFEVGHSTIVVGGQRGPWWRPTPERLLARVLLREGHRVIFVETTARKSRVVATRP